MSNQFTELDSSESWNVLVDAAKRGMEENGFKITRLPGRGRSNVWEIKQKGSKQLASIRTTKDRWFAFPPLEEGKKWKTLDDVDVVIVSAVDDVHDPQNVQIYQFDAAEVRKRFDESYARRIEAGHIVRDNFGMWVALDEDDRGLPASVGSGLSKEHPPIASYSLDEFMSDKLPGTTSDTKNNEAQEENKPQTIADVMDWARQRIAALSGVRADAVKLDLKIEH